MKSYNFIAGPCDTDSISFCKPDMSEFTEEEFQALIKEINDMSPEFIEWEHDGNYKLCLIAAAKNYAIVDFKGKKTVRGSALKDPKRCKALLQYTLEFVDLLLEERNDELLGLYDKYVQEIINIKDINPWVKKLTISDKMVKCVGHESMTKEEKKAKGIRANETKPYDAFKHKPFQEGNKIYLYFKKDKSYGLAEDFDGNYSKQALLKNLYNVTKVFQNVVDFEQFTNWSLVANLKKLCPEDFPKKEKKSKKKVHEIYSEETDIAMKQYYGIKE